VDHLRPADTRPSDADLLARSRDEPEAFGAFYRRHVDWVLRLSARRTGSPEHAADLTAEVFAAALLGVRRYRPEAGAPNNWLFGILLNKLAGFERRGAVERRARRRLGLDTPVLAADEYQALLDAGGDGVDGHDVVALLERLPDDQRRAVRGRVVEERTYAELASELAISEAGARKRVSRGLAAMRAELEREASL
jgi:RNA polymerase sigma factor (sigma-70 family)